MEKEKYLPSRELLQELVFALAYYIERQIVSHDLMLKLGIDAQDIASRGAAGCVQVPSYGYVENQDGVWRYNIHGKGFRIIHTVTKEPIDWECPSYVKFDDFFFLRHLKWRLQFLDEKRQIPKLAAWVENHQNRIESVLPLLDTLRNMGIISKGNTLNSSINLGSYPDNEQQKRQ